jgi:UDP-N-acetylmuramate dehydrogenase
MADFQAMAASIDQTKSWQTLETAFGARLQRAVSLARYTSARVGGRADGLLEVLSSGELAQAANLLWDTQTPFIVLGGGSNVLVSDAGIRGIVILNHARQFRFDSLSATPQVWAESGANFGALARQAAQHEFSGLEWAAGIPGTVGGAVIGNAGAHGSDMAANLKVAEILHQDGKIESWSVEKLKYGYRSSSLKHQPGEAAGDIHVRTPEVIVLSAMLDLRYSSSEAVLSTIDAYTAQRRRTQPPGASMGSMFKNPPGDYAGRLIEAAGLKGLRIGNAAISTQHANFFVNLGDARAADMYSLIKTAQAKVFERTGITLELEIELLGEW